MTFSTQITIDVEVDYDIMPADRDWPAEIEIQSVSAQIGNLDVSRHVTAAMERELAKMAEEHYAKHTEQEDTE